MQAAEEDVVSGVVLLRLKKAGDGNWYLFGESQLGEFTARHEVFEAREQGLVRCKVFVDLLRDEDGLPIFLQDSQIPVHIEGVDLQMVVQAPV